MKFRNRKGDVLEYSQQEIAEFIKNMEETNLNILVIPECITDNHYFIVE